MVSFFILYTLIKNSNTFAIPIGDPYTLGIKHFIYYMNKVVHFEVPIDDVERAKKFYRDVFGWEITSVPMEGGSTYEMVRTGPVDEKMSPAEVGFINGGMTMRSELKENSVIVIDVPNLDEHLAKIESAGGSVVMPKTSVGTMGWYARAKDSEGNIIGVWEVMPKE